MKNMVLIIVTAGMFLLITEESYGIPEFARKYKTSCTTCHTAIPKRNAFGEAFRRNGFVLPKGDAQLIKEEPVSLGAEGWKEAFPDAIWPGVIPPNLPISVYVHNRLTYDPLKPEGKKIGFDMPHELELLFGGAFGNDVGLFGEWIFFEGGQNAVGMQRFFFQFNDIVGPKDALNIKVGRIEPGITSGYMNANRITLDRPITIDYKASGDWRPRDNQTGIEINGILESRFEYSAGVLNGEGKATPFKDRKDVFARVAYKVGGMGLDGSGADVELKETDNWEDNAVTVGAYTYVGNYLKTPSEGGATYSNNFNRFGFDLRAGYGRMELTGGVILGEDENPFGNLKKLKHTAYFSEVDYIFYPWLIGVFRVNRAQSKLVDDDRDKYWEINPNITILYRANIKFSIEGRFRVDEKRTIDGVEKDPSEKRAFRVFRINAMIAF
ncbi:MAG: hypothetical protein A2315_13585 [Ignavibacteria bacterium RIFOXYB2_FULL_35_12]|nr:MAG: hypothetical protein A2X60_03515 [Ignavibacteria bacterium GWF2_35_20]OGU78656.1 MAG: hypothetical protein A2254_00575 [Ignavibacteria bacterium RIFOXYA2_FULL_35_9]OGU87323.1 MAG: hypothetical protein A2492_00420 [Ignavibacteria bacterium RIFOXYC12_FULL_35_11]OGU89791.1 MAG: hypothetical protein A3K31_13115 [Ignavibacteria bacterium RIFOXYA12_FULL_35_25]OGU95314.1 MAG: hypothetical protein A2347_09650 [Ignavibacteria bacterium RIFOXYB12_FULL_35_14]OGV01458.1 MAG: hypothetical protein A